MCSFGYAAWTKWWCEPLEIFVRTYPAARNLRIASWAFTPFNHYEQLFSKVLASYPQPGSRRRGASVGAQYSPMLEQYFGMKARHPEAILLSRVGDFYEAYGEDAETIARALSIALTSKEAGSGQRVAMAGVPHHALSGYLARLVQQRFIVALAEQLEMPQPNKLVRRDVVRLITPGTVIEDQLLDGRQNNYLAAVACVDETFALAYADVSTGLCEATALTNSAAYDELVAELDRIGPAEIVADMPTALRSAVTGALEEKGVRVAASPLSAVESRPRGAIEGFSIDEALAIHRALDALSAFVRKTGLNAPLGTPSFYRNRQFLALDAHACKHLELTKALGANPKATLLATLDKCATSMGARLLARWIAAPVLDAKAIQARQEAVGVLVAEHVRRDSIQELLRSVFDLERIAQKVRFKKIVPRDLASLRRTLEVFEPLRQVVPKEIAARLSPIGGFDEMLGDLQRTLTAEPPALLSDCGVIRPEINAELAECIALRQNARSAISELEERERTRTGIKSLKIKYASAFGYAIEISKSYTANVPADYVRKQTLTSGERYVTQELKELEVAISSAQTRQQRLEEQLFGDLVDRVGARLDELVNAAQALAELDVFCSLGQCAAERHYVKPEIMESGALELREARHPVMEVLIGSNFVPNDLQLREGEHRFILLTGPNMGGKSTFLRQAALICIMAQIGSFVPAKSARIPIVDRIFTRIGAGDDLASGQSTFYVEMAEAAAILRRCTRRSLLLIDEVGRGTSTIDGLAIAQAMSEFLLGLEAEAPMVLFATHFHELVALADHWKLVANYHVTAVEKSSNGGAPVFSHRVLAGSTSRSFGIEVARMAGLPDAVIERAQEIAEALSGKADVEVQAPLRRKLAKVEPAERQLSFLREQ